MPSAAAGTRLCGATGARREHQRRHANRIPRVLDDACDLRRGFAGAPSWSERVLSPRAA